jgi:hypothetical protein
MPYFNRSSIFFTFFSIDPLKYAVKYVETAGCGVLKCTSLICEDPSPCLLLLCAWKLTFLFGILS